ncbi:hypothetical protein HPP92_020544 [Vanilla planifolia]|uniref:Uncharacterized protein n=1 Tax=Vanilla planifolia TaxID=51239 RepID=A0A835UHZ2_VANPL|nr:hypothetical protein HPP92_020544 [Vanilla planifolia]
MPSFSMATTSSKFSSTPAVALLIPCSSLTFIFLLSFLQQLSPLREVTSSHISLQLPSQLNRNTAVVLQVFLALDFVILIKHAEAETLFVFLFKEILPHCCKFASASSLRYYSTSS